MAKRRPMTGKGSDVFIAPLAAAEERLLAEASQAADLRVERERREKRVMVTVYLPPTLVDKLDRAWVERRRRDRKAQKSHLVAEALETYLKDFKGVEGP
jgi:hypothetical protein